MLLVVSDLTVAELGGAPPAVWNLFNGLSDDVVERVGITSECEALRDGYLFARVVGKASASDALHIAIATVVGADLVVSWNFKHIVHHTRIAGFEGVNLMRGYRSPRI